MKTDIYQTITDRIVAQIEQGAGKWQMPWHCRDGHIGTVPRNLTGRSYRGINVPVLWFAAQERGYASPIWGSYKQWLEHGAQVRKGEKSTMVVFWKSFETKVTDDNGDEHYEKRMHAQSYLVFNASQVDGFDENKGKRPRTVEDLSEEERIASADVFFAVVGSTVRHGGDRAFYSTASDHIQMPLFEQFHNAVAYYATLAHEHVHWTGHKDRCEREFGKRFGDAAYAFEELVAELGAAFLCATLGLTNEARPDHAAYVDSWLKTLKADKRAIFTAASKAQAAIDYLEAAAVKPVVGAAA